MRKSRRHWEENIKTDAEEIEWVSLKWIYLNKDIKKCQSAGSTVKSALRKMPGI
jgi:hypothetical protein